MYFWGVEDNHAPLDAGTHSRISSVPTFSERQHVGRTAHACPLPRLHSASKSLNWSTSLLSLRRREAGQGGVVVSGPEEGPVLWRDHGEGAPLHSDLDQQIRLRLGEANDPQEREAGSTIRFLLPQQWGDGTSKAITRRSEELCHGAECPDPGHSSDP